MSTAPTATGLAIERAGAAELDQVMRLMAAAFDPAFGEAWTKGQCAGILGLPGVWLLIAREDARCVGFALARLVVDEAELLLLAVTPAARRCGVGGALLDAVATEAARRGASRLHLEMRDGNPARALYDIAGFAEVGRRRAYYRGAGGERFDAITLACAIAPAATRPVPGLGVDPGPG